MKEGEPRDRARRKEQAEGEEGKARKEQDRGGREEEDKSKNDPADG